MEPADFKSALHASIDGGGQDKTSQSAEAPAAPSPLPSINLPKGGGAIRGIGEKFSVNSVTGAGSLSVPLASSPGRSGFGPQLALSYDSGSGNGPFGFGWSLGLPEITRKTDKGRPRYLDGDESDVFLISGAEDLVPILDGAEKQVAIPRTLHGVAYTVYPYRPRIEGMFARIERWTETATGISHWRTITKENITTLFGLDENSRITDAGDPRKTFSYLICLTFDKKGNATQYEYAKEDSSGVDAGAANEANRTPEGRAVQRYVKYIRYGNFDPYYSDWSTGGAAVPFPDKWHFQVVFDYGDHSPGGTALLPDRSRPVRPDPFSHYRGGFEVRSYRRVKRVLLFHSFPAEPTVGTDALVRSTDFVYSDETTPADPANPIYTFLESAAQTGYKRGGAGYQASSAPPLEFFYSPPHVQPDVFSLDDDDSRNHLPEGVDGSRFQLIDLNGEGLLGVLTEEDNGWSYKRNLGPLKTVVVDHERQSRAQFGPPESVGPLPVPAHLSRGQQLLDLTGGGRLDLVALDGPSTGYFARSADDGWEPFRTFSSLPRIDWSQANLRFVDLTGDGLSDVLITEDEVFTFYASLGRDGFGEAERVPISADEERGPRVVFANGAQTVSLADMCGDGLRDLVRIRNGEVCYWPNLGYGRFGAKVTMDHSPRFTDEERFDAKRIRLADIDGSGTTDIVYLGNDGVQVCFNRSGNSFAEPQLLAVFPNADDLGSIQVTDFLGNGTACLVWSSPLPGEAQMPLRYIDLMGSRKPHLLVRMRNNLGAETRISYSSSTRFYLEDERDGHPWITKLPFPVHIADRVETYDFIGRSRFVSRYSYHQGYFDGYEREFRGFGRVDRRDTDQHRDDTLFPEVETSNEDQASFVPPVLTRTWIHTGAFTEAHVVSGQYEHEYWVEPAMRGDSLANTAAREALLVPDTVLPVDLTPEEIREAYRALKGSTLRVEVYGEDGTSRAQNPYTITEQNFTVRRIQGFGRNRHAVFLTHPRESISFHYERQADDPRVTHDFTLETDVFGNVLRSVSVGYARRAGFLEPEPALSLQFRTMLKHDQTRLHVSAVQRQYTKKINDPSDGVLFDAYRAPMASETITAELTGIAQAGPIFRFTEIDPVYLALWTGASDIACEDVASSDIDGTPPVAGAPARRIVEHTRTVYRSDDLSALLPLGTAEPLGLPGDSFRLAMTPGLITRLFGARVNDAMLAEGGYVKLGGQNDWWIRAGRSFFSAGDADTSAQELTAARAHFFVARRAVDPFGGVGRVDYDNYDILPVATTDAGGNTTRALNDYRLLLPLQMTDPNLNLTGAAFDILGRVTGTMVGGKAGEGDSLAGFNPDLTDAEIGSVRANPLSGPAALLGNATSRFVYDLFAYFRTRGLASPDAPMAYTLSRETHVSDLGGGSTKFQHGFSYSDGFAREVQRKVQAEPGAVTGVAGVVNPRWTGTGWSIFNNKGKPIRTYEPFFSQTHQFEFDKRVGVSSVQFYDPVERVVATLHPDNTFEKTVFDTWKQQVWDANDTVMISDARVDPDVGDFLTRLFGSAPGAFVSWRDRRIGGAWGATPEQKTANQDAAQKATLHAATPAVMHFDSLGRTCLNIADNGSDRFPTRTALDFGNRPLAVVDALGHRVVEYCFREPVGGGSFRYVAGYDIAGRATYSNSSDRGERRTLNEVAAKPIRSWNARGFMFRILYDILRRPTHRFVSLNGAGEILRERQIYGDRHPDPSLNLKGKLYRHYDGAGVAITERCDFKGNVLESGRELAVTYASSPDWMLVNAVADVPSLNLAALDAATTGLLDTKNSFAASARFDALNRPIQAVTPHSASGLPSVVQPAYNEARLLEKVDVWIRQAVPPPALLNPATADVHAVTNLDYNALGQRLQCDTGNGASTTYSYDPETFRMTGMTTTRANPDPNALIVQELHYTLDPVGNITRIRDLADIHNVIYFRNQRVEPSSDYTYDAVYRLIAATGREHLGQNGGGGLNPAQQVTNDDSFRMGGPSPGEGNAMGNYTERYVYDHAGNILQMLHLVASGGWTRVYSYAEPSRITAAEVSNRLSATSVPGDNPAGPYNDRYVHDEHGNMVRMPHLPVTTWDEADHLRSSSRQVVIAGVPETTYYAYDAGSERLRKVTEKQAGPGAAAVRMAERIYLGVVEIYHEYAADGTTITLERETLHVMDDQRRVALVETRTAGIDPSPKQLVCYQYSSHLGSSTVELDDIADVISYEEYFPYGSTSYQAMANQSGIAKRYRFTGKERDTENDLDYHGARYCAPWLGRWTSCDPGGTVDGPNLYQYTRSNPIQYSDPTGHDSTDPKQPPKGDDTAAKQEPAKSAPEKTDSGDNKGDADAPQTFLPLLGLTNGAWMGQYPKYTLRTEFATLIPVTSVTDRKLGATAGPTQYLSISDRLSSTFELSVVGYVGGTIPLSPKPDPGEEPAKAKGTGMIGVGMHWGPEAPSDKTKTAFGTGHWLTLSDVGGAEPDKKNAPPGWSANPSANYLFAASWQRPNKWAFDINGGAALSRWGSVNGVPVGAFFGPFVGANYARNVTDAVVVNGEATVTENFGFAGRFDDQPSTGLPKSTSVNAGIGVQYMWGDYGIGVELWGFGETNSTVSNPGASGGNYGGGLRFGFGAINPRREHVEVESPDPPKGW